MIGTKILKTVYSGSGVEHYGVYFPRRTPWMHLVVDEYGKLIPEMKDVFEAYPDRFFTGTDIAHARVYERYAHHFPRWRFIFQQLSTHTARKIAYGNADRLFGRALTAERQPSTSMNGLADAGRSA